MKGLSPFFWSLLYVPFNSGRLMPPLVHSLHHHHPHHHIHHPHHHIHHHHHPHRPIIIFIITIAIIIIIMCAVPFNSREQMSLLLGEFSGSLFFQTHGCLKSLKSDLLQICGYFGVKCLVKRYFVSDLLDFKNAPLILILEMTPWFSIMFSLIC